MEYGTIVETETIGKLENWNSERVENRTTVENETTGK